MERPFRTGALFDGPAAEDLLAVIEDDGLPGGDGALRKRGQLDGLTELAQFADKLEQACFTTLAEGTMTKDLVGLVDEGTTARAVTSAEFIAAIRANLEKSI